MFYQSQCDKITSQHKEKENYRKYACMSRLNYTFVWSVADQKN
jgi:hypothetical protein